MQVPEFPLALPFPALQWHQCGSECILVTVEIHLTTLFNEIFCLRDFFLWDGTGWDGQTDTHTDGKIIQKMSLELQLEILLSKKLIFKNIVNSNCFKIFPYIK